MVGPRPAGSPWTPEDDRRLMAMVEAGVDKAMVARKLKRTVAAIISRLGKLRQLQRRKYASMSRSLDAEKVKRDEPVAEVCRARGLR
jgi:hypothetical protein